MKRVCPECQVCNPATDSCELPCDTDNDGNADSCWLCDPNDGGYPPTACWLCDSDQDGVLDDCNLCTAWGPGHNKTSCYECDTDNDGFNDDCKRCRIVDPDSGGVPDYICPSCDNDGDGVKEGCIECDLNYDGYVDGCPVCDKDGDGINESCPTPGTKTVLDYVILVVEIRNDALWPLWKIEESIFSPVPLSPSKSPWGGTSLLSEPVVHEKDVPACYIEDPNSPKVSTEKTREWWALGVQHLVYVITYTYDWVPDPNDPCCVERG